MFNDPSTIDWEKVIYVVFDLETTGGNRQKHEIIELAAVILDKNGIPIEDATFSHFVKPNRAISQLITNLTSITNAEVCDADKFPNVAGSFIRFMQHHANYSDGQIDHILLVGHNGRSFDIPFWIEQLRNHNLEGEFFGDIRFGFGLDSLRLAKDAVKSRVCQEIPSAYNLKTLFEFVTGKAFDTGHRAYEDVKATITVLKHDPFWSHRKKNLFKFAIVVDQQQQAEVPTAAVENDDSSASSGDSGSVSSSSSSEEEEEGAVALGNRWQNGATFDPPVPTPMQQFEEYVTATSTRSTQRRKTGLQCSPFDVNSPIRAWRQIFTKSILDRIVNHTNEYGRRHAKKWSDICRKDLEGFIAILFISGIQKRKDKPSNWFSDNKVLENPVMKKIMSGRKFFTILRYLHCCPVENRDPTAPDYDPAYKITEVRDYLEERYTKLFSPGQQLSLDETLLRAFGRIKFKVRIISKSARYGIKIYVITDARTAYVLRVIIYTGKTTYSSTGDVAEQPLKTVQIVNKLAEPFRNTFRTIYIDRFYTSIDLVRSLAEHNLYVTGTLLANRIPSDIRISKSSAQFRAMKRGDAVMSKFIFYKADGTMSECGLVGWKDRNMVYCLSNDSTNHLFDDCYRRGDGGIISVPRPLSISNYNKFMGGVDLADMIRLSCNSNIMGGKRWWLRLFFYNLDVGTSNARVLYNEQLKDGADNNGTEYRPMNIVQFKMQLVEDLAGKSIHDLLHGRSPEDDETTEHRCVPIPNGARARCAYCSLLSRGSSRTRYQCIGCGVPLCHMGNGQVKYDCFREAHETDDRREMVLAKYLRMQAKNTRQKQK
jgi:DNA polymerase III epsilon subunit-like protein